MMTVCGVCGKRIVVTWPEFWVYKTGKGEETTYYCSENCLVVADTREMKDRIGWVDPQAELTEEEIETVISGRPVGFRRLKRTVHREVPKETPAKPAGQEREDRTMAKYASSHKLTREEKERAVELAISGGDPISYLRELGAKNPWASWAYVKQTLKKAKPELYAQLPSDESRLDEEVSYGAKAASVKEQALPEKFEGGLTAQVADEEAEWTALPAAGNQTAAAGGDPSTPLRSAQDDKLVINAEDLAAAEDPAVKRMEAFAEMETTYRVPPVSGRLVLDEHGLHTVKAEDPPKPEKPLLAEIAEKVPDVDASMKAVNVRMVPSVAGQTVESIQCQPADEPVMWHPEKFLEDAAPEGSGIVERSTLIHDEHGVRMVTERLLDDLPCAITGLKVNEFEFNLNRAGMVLILPESDRNFLQPSVTLTLDQWRRLVKVVPKVMKILRIE